MDLIDLRRLLTQLAMPLPVGLGLTLLAGGLALLVRKKKKRKK